MKPRGNSVTSSFLLVTLTSVLSGLALTCHRAEYQIGEECCPMCNPGSRVKIHCTFFRSTSCLPCEDGTYMDKPSGLQHCFLCGNCDAGSGLKVKRLCTSKSDIVCEPLKGFYCVDSDKVGCLHTRRHRSCQPGQFISQNGTALTDSVCSNCSTGTFSDGTFTSCQSHTKCESLNLPLMKAGTASADAECGEENSNTTAIVIGSIVVFLAIAAAGAAVCVLHFKKRKERKRKKGDHTVCTEVTVALDIKPKIPCSSSVNLEEIILPQEPF